MIAKEITNEIYSRFEKQGFKGTIVSIDHIHELHSEIEGPHKTGLVSEDLYREYLAYFDFNVPSSLSEAKSIIIVAVPQPLISLSFALNGRPLLLYIPPTYDYKTDKNVETLIFDLIDPKGYRLIKASLPLKVLAVHSGLAQYGKNNITYVNGMGSFYRLVAYYSDLPCERDNWGELQTMDRCLKCSACGNVCPVGAIASERFLIRAERCITFHNERSGDFPEWLDSSWHNCLVGCLHCQRFCPINKEFLTWTEEGMEFSPLETRLLLGGASRDELPAETVRKLQQLCLLDYLEVLPRNLDVLFEQAKVPHEIE